MMTDERLAELRKWRDVLRSEQMNAEFPKMEAIADAVDEVDRLRYALECIAESPYMCAGFQGCIPVGHDLNCAVGQANIALRFGQD